MKSIIRTTVFALASVVLILLGAWSVFQFHPSLLSAQTTESTAELTGWIWSGTQNAADGSRQGMGWISLNCENDSSCGRVDYQVEIDLNTMNLSGYAWAGITRPGASNTTTGLGWLRFGGVGCPAGSIDSDGNCAARVTGDHINGWELTGWARACSVFENPAACSGTLAANDVRGGWDGWVSLNCDNHASGGCRTYRVVFNDDGVVDTDRQDSTAWGDNILGALSFKHAAIDGPTCANVPLRCSADGMSSIRTEHNLWCEPRTTTTSCPYGCNPTTGQCNAQTVITDIVTNSEITVSSEIVRRGDTVTVSWDIDEAAATSGITCSVTGGGVNLTGLSGSGSQDVTITLNQVTFTLTCAGQTVDTATVRTLPETYES